MNRPFLTPGARPPSAGGEKGGSPTLAKKSTSPCLAGKGLPPSLAGVHFAGLFAVKARRLSAGRLPPSTRSRTDLLTVSYTAREEWHRTSALPGCTFTSSSTAGTVMENIQFPEAASPQEERAAETAASRTRRPLKKMIDPLLRDPGAGSQKVSRESGPDSTMSFFGASLVPHTLASASALLWSPPPLEKTSLSSQSTLKATRGKAAEYSFTTLTALLVSVAALFRKCLLAGRLKKRSSAWTRVPRRHGREA